MNKKISCMVLTLIALSGTYGCAIGEEEDHEVKTQQVHKEDGKVVNVIENVSDVVYQDIAIENIEKKEKITAVSWLDDERILIMKENKDLYEGLDFHVSSMLTNLYIHNVNTGEETLLGDSSVSQVECKLSPDKQYVYYVNFMPVPEGERAIATAKVVDLNGNIKVSIEEEDIWVLRDAVWSADNEIIFAVDSKVQVTDLEGNVSTYPKVETEKTIGQIGKIGDRLFYTLLEDQSLWSYDFKSDTKTLVSEMAPSFTISPDGTQMIIGNIEPDKGIENLILIDLETDKREVLTTGKFIYGIEWVKDGSRISYMKNDTEPGLYVMLMESRAEHMISQEYFGQGVAFWSPSGQKLMLNYSGSDENGYYISLTHIITLK